MYHHFHHHQRGFRCQVLSTLLPIITAQWPKEPGRAPAVTGPTAEPDGTRVMRRTNSVSLEVRGLEALGALGIHIFESWQKSVLYSFIFCNL